MAASSTASTPCCWPLRRCGTLRLFTRCSRAFRILKRLAILGSTGSIGQSTLSIVEQFPDRYSVAALAAGRNLDEAFAQAVRWRPQVVSLATEELAAQLSARLQKAGVTGIEVVHGTEGTIACATLSDAEFVVSAIVGVAGLEATHAAILAGKPVGLRSEEHT